MEYRNNDLIYRNKIKQYLIHRAHEVRVDANGNLMNLSVLSENFYCEFLNILLGLSLENANASRKNTAGIDLIDWTNHVAAQVSVTCAPNTIRKKIRNSIQRFDKPGGEAWQFYFVPIKDEAPDLTKGFALPEGLAFDHTRDVLDISRIMTLADRIDKLEQLAALVEKYSARERLRSALKLEPLGRGKARSRFEYNARVVPLLGRAREMADLRGFVAGDPRDFAWWAVAGPGGAGKTRLAFELQEALLAGGEWDVGVIPAAVLEKYEQQESDISDACPGRTLLIVDYVQRYTGALALLLRRLSDPAAERNAPLRLLLLERDVRDEQGLIPWWEQLWGADYHVREACYARSPMVLAPMAAPEGAADPLETLIRDFADALCDDSDADCPRPHRLPEGKEADLRQRLEDIDPGLLRPLIAMILADAWVRDPKTERWSRDELLRHIVDREWDMVARRLEDFHTRLLPGACRIVWMAATVLSAGASPLSCDRLPALLPRAWEVIEGAAERHADALESWTLTLPESLLNRAGLLTEGLVQPLRPDLLGEYFVLEGLCRLGRNERSAFYTAVLRELAAAEVFFNRMLDDYAALLREDPDRQAALFPEAPGLDPEATADYSLLLRRLFERSRDSVTRGWLCARLTALAAGQETQNGETARICGNAASVLDDMGNYPKALQFYEKSLKIKEAVLGPEHPDTAGTYNNIGEVYRVKGDYPKALEFYEKSLKIKEAVLGSEHPDTAGTYNNMAATYDEMGDYPKALDFYEKALKIKEAVLGPEHPGTAQTYYNLALLYFQIHDLDKAVRYSDQALEVWQRVLGPAHPYTVKAKGFNELLHKENGNDV